MNKKLIIIETLNPAETGSLQGNYSHIDRYAMTAKVKQEKSPMAKVALPIREI